MANGNLIIGANMANLATGVPRPAEAVQQRAQAETERPGDSRRTEEVKPEAQERELSDVIAVSRDGDTVQASNEAVRELNEDQEVGKVIGDPENARIRRGQETNGTESREELLTLELERSAAIREAQIEAAQEESEERREQATEALREAEETDSNPDTQRAVNAVLADEKETIAEEGQISSFIGYSDAELERMYLQGSISKFDYDQEMESRAAEAEARREDLADFALETGDRAAQLERSERQGEEIERAFSDTANERLDATNRAQLIQTMQRTAQAENSDPNQIASLTNFALG